MKPSCVCCNRTIPMTEVRYEYLGNYCGECSGRAAKIALLKTQIRTRLISNKDASVCQNDLQTLVNKAPSYTDISVSELFSL